MCHNGESKCTSRLYSMVKVGHAIGCQLAMSVHSLGITGDPRLKPRLRPGPHPTWPGVLKPNHSLVLLVNNKSAPIWEHLVF